MNQVRVRLLSLASILTLLPAVAFAQSDDVADLLFELDGLTAIFPAFAQSYELEDDQDASFLYGDRKGIVHHYVSEGGRLREIWKSFPLEGAIKELWAQDLGGDGRPEIVVLTNSSRIYVFETDKYELLWESIEISERISTVQAMLVADADNDPQLELVVCADNKIRYIDGADFYIEKEGRDFLEPGMMLIADVDNDLEAEIITNDGYVIDTNTLNIEWANDGFGYPISLFDLDNDGVLEVVGESQGSVAFWDVEDRREIW